GKYMRILAIVGVITLISSVIIAFTLIPTLAKDFFRYKKRREKIKPGYLLQFYQKVLVWCIEKKRRSFFVITSFLLVFISSFLLFTIIPLNTILVIFYLY